MEIFNIAVLSLSGLMLFIVAGFLRLVNPIKNYLNNSGIIIENEVNILSEVRGMSTLMMFGGLIVGLGAIIPAFRFTSFVVAILIFGSYAVGRLISFAIDGKPNKLIAIGLITEIVLSLVHTFCLINILD